MTYRRNVLVLSILAATCIHVALYLAAPEIYLLKANSASREFERRFNVDLVEIAPPEVDQWRVLSDEPRPESIRDLLRREDEMLYPDSFEREWVEIPDQTDRLSDGAGEREHDLEFDAENLRTMEAKVLEIEARDARAEVEVARRVVSASEPRFLGPDDLPTLLGPDAEGGRGGGGFFSALGSSFDDAGDTGALAGAGGGPSETRPDYVELTPSDSAVRPDIPALGVEDLVARDAIKSAIRQENNFDVLDASVSIGVQTYLDTATGEGFFKLTISPERDAPIPTIPKEVTFVLDASTSIGQRKLDGAARGLTECIRSLAPDDKFNIVIFRDTPAYLWPTLTFASPENKQAASEFLNNLESKGATDVYSAMKGVVQQPPARGIADFIVLVTDGRPTGNALAGRDLINALTADNLYRRTIYTVGAGTSANRYLLDLLAYRNKGVTYISPRSEAMVTDLPQFFSQVREPVLVDLRADYGRIPRDEVYPSEVPDFYRGRVVTVYGKFDPARDKDVVMRLHGRSGSQEKELVFKANLSAANTGDPAIAREWAFQKSYYIIGEICAVGESPELVNELNRLSRTYGVRTSYTP